MVGEARRRNPGLEFREGDMLALDLAPDSLVGIVAFYAIVNLPQARLVEAFSQMWRVLEAKGLLLVAFHVGNEIVRPDELWGVRVTMDFYLHSPDVVCRSLDAAAFTVEDIAEREPYPEVEYQSRLLRRICGSLNQQTERFWSFRSCLRGTRRRGVWEL
jgi:SAM-dependent methyltransferase